MAFYFSSDTKALYDTDVFPVGSLPANKVEITEAAYIDLMTKQNQGYVILADGSGNPYTVNQSEAAATDIKHAASVATTLALGHVKIGNTMQAANDGTLDLKDGAVTTDKIADGSITEEKMESLKNIQADEVTITMNESASDFTFSVKDGGISSNKLANNSVYEQHIFDGAVTEDKLATQSVGTSKIANQAVTTTKIANKAVTTDKIEDGAIGATQIENQAIRSQHLNAYAVETNAINTGAVTTQKIADSAVRTAKIENGAVTHEKLGSTTRIVVPFTDSSNNDLNGTDWGDTWADTSVAKMIGKIGSYVAGRLVDFTLSFGFRIPSSSIPVDFSFQIFIGNMNAHVAIENRTVNVTDDSYFVHERFAFKVPNDTEIQVSIYPGSTNRVSLKNIQLRGFVL